MNGRPSHVTEERMARLPVWAAGYIRALEQENRGYKSDEDEIDGERTNVVGVTWVPERRYPLPASAHVEFTVDPDAFAHYNSLFRASVKDGRLEISGDSAMQIRMRASNVIEIEYQDRVHR